MSRTIKKEYTKSKRFDKTCRCHGGCNWCEGNRLIRTRKEFDRTSLKYDINTYHRLEEEAYYTLPDTYEEFTHDYTQHESFIG